MADEVDVEKALADISKYSKELENDKKANYSARQCAVMLVALCEVIRDQEQRITKLEQRRRDAPRD